MTRALTAALLLAMVTGCAGARPASAVRGQTLYAENGCVSCHGPRGRGDGPVGRTLSPPPRDFTNLASYANGSDEASIAATLARGIDRNGAKMPAFAHLTDVERRSLALYVITLRTTPDERTD